MTFPGDARANGTSPVTAGLRQAFSQAETQFAAAMERLVASRGFADLLAQAAHNAVALSAVNAQLWDLTLRNLRMSGRADIDRLARRLNALDDKLEVLLQEVERLAEQRATVDSP